MLEPGFLIALVLAMGLFMTGLGGARWRARRRLAAARSGAGGGIFLLFGGLMIAASLNLVTYQRLTMEQPVATLTFEQIGPRRFAARVAPEGKPARRFELAGDQWQLDARVLKWSGLANLIGLDAQYRLERLSGRYARVEHENTGLRTAYNLAAERGLDVWRIAERYPDWLPLVDASYGSGTYLPMADGAQYAVTMTQSGLIARPLNPAAETAARNW